MVTGGEVPRVVVGVDGSPASHEALRWAAGYAGLVGATVAAVSAFDLPGAVGWSAPAMDAEFDGTLARQALTEEVQEVLTEAGDVPLETHLVRGNPAMALVEASADAELLVVGSRGRGGFASLLLGSVSQQCAAHASCPVVIVPSESVSRAGTATTPAKDQARRVVVGIDGSPTSYEALRWAARHARLIGATVHAMAAYDVPGAVGRSAPPAAAAPDDREARHVLSEEIRTVLDPIGAVPLAEEVVPGNPAKALIGASAGAAVLVVGSRGRGGFASLLLGSVGQQCATHASCPVVIVRPDASG
ncbi:universal stress protein [Streptomyces sp. P9(2023)]|uniref:universal stress protein n=1 Tax=Streptomyces sp. P9(2023) TaxID=3064394 RepID=UPI0028F4351E|nr:universal stress protein [Streptomyces sp. P9(2023)]MDT9686823.1 universal stress protein [Streptomyces sp. P9(2023)]